MADNPNTRERRKFEEWFEASQMPAKLDWFRRDPEFPEMYDKDATHFAWKGWAARAGVADHD
jgi:hypothetical protein